MNSSGQPEAWELADYWRVLRRRWWAVVLLACVGLAIAAAAVKVLPKSYTAYATVSVNALPLDTRALPAGGTLDMDNEAQLVQSRAVARLAAKSLHYPTSPSALSSEVTVTVPANTTFLQIACKASNASHAADCANAFASAYLTTRLAQTATAVQGQLTAVKQKANKILPQVVQLNASGYPTKQTAKIAHHFQLKSANTQLDALLSRINYLTSELASLQGPNNASAGSITAAARTPSSASSPRKTLILPSGLAVGLVVGLLLAFGLELRDERLHGARDVELACAVPTLLDLTGKRAKSGRDLVPSGSEPLKAFELAEYVANIPAEDRCFVVLVAGATPESGTSLVAVNLAAALSKLRSDVFLVSGGPEATRVPQLLGVENRTGLAQLLAGTTTIDKAARSPRDFADLRVIGPGRARAGAALRNTFDARHDLVADLRSQARIVILEAPLGGGASPAFSLAEFADAAILVVETTRTKRSELKGWLGQLERLRVAVLGAVIVPRLDRAARTRSKQPPRRGRIVRRRAPSPAPAVPIAAGGERNGRDSGGSVTISPLR